jgi:hypothetical protein
MEARSKNESVLLPLFLSRTAGLELAQSCGGKSHARCDAILVQARGRGIRLDAVDTLFEDPKLTDNPVLPGKDKFGRSNMKEKYNKKLPEVHDLMRKLPPMFRN